jgi:hypothetical protein
MAPQAKANLTGCQASVHYLFSNGEPSWARSVLVKLAR